MIQLLKNCLLLSSSISKRNIRCFFLTIAITSCVTNKAQIANYVNNGSFEENYICASPYLKDVVYWNSLDSANLAAGVYTNKCNLNGCCSVPLSGYSYQYPRTGDAFVLGQFFCPACMSLGPERGYFKNRLKAKLNAGKVYCSKMYINSVDACKYSINSMGMYYGSVELDTITKQNQALPWIIPQIQTLNIIYDTLNWVAVTGTFVATGNEKYLVIGCFKTNSSVNYSITNTTEPEWAGYNVDDVSCIELDLAAYAGRDTSIAPGDSAFIGREPDFAVDSGCTWYQLPNLTTPIKKMAGFWVKPVTTTTYVVRQILDCSAEKWDTVAVYVDAVGIEKKKKLNNELKIYPIPAKDQLELKITNENLLNKFKQVAIFNTLGQLIREEALNYESKTIKVNDLENGIYFLQLKSTTGEIISKRFVISK